MSDRSGLDQHVIMMCPAFPLLLFMNNSWIFFLFIFWPAVTRADFHVGICWCLQDGNVLQKPCGLFPSYVAIKKKNLEALPLLLLQKPKSLYKESLMLPLMIKAGMFLDVCP